MQTPAALSTSKTWIKKLIRKIIGKYQEARSQVDAQLFWQHLALKISPGLIEEFDDHLTIDKTTQVKCLVVGVPHFGKVGYPKQMNPRIIDELLSLSAKGFTIAYSFTAIPIEPNTSMRLLDDALYYTDVNQQGYKGANADGKGHHELELDRNEYLELYDQLHRGSQKLYHTALIIVIWAKDDNELRTAEGMVKTALEANRITYEIPFFRMLEVFIASMPVPLSTEIAWRELTSHACASLAAMRNPNSRTDESGLYFGEDKTTGKNIVIDLKNLAAQHLMLVGPTGSGKTFTLMMMLMRAHDMLNKRIIYTTPKPDVTTNYRAVAEYYGESASIVDIGPSGRNINPLEIMYDAQGLVDELAYIRAFDDHLELLDQFFTVLFEGTKTINMSSYINESLIRCYRQKGILRDDPDSWKNVIWPTLLDLRGIWEEDARDPKDVTAKALMDKTYKVNTSWSYMNRQSDIDLSTDFIVVDISNVPASIQEAMNVFVTGIMGMRFRTDAKKETIIAVDESRIFLLNPKLSTFMIRTLTQGRSYNIALWLATQQTADLVKAQVEDEFKTNISISIVLGNMRPDTIEHVKEFYKLNETDINHLMSCGVGEGLLLVGSEVIPTKFKPTQHEMDIIKGRLGEGKKNQPTDVSYKLVHNSLYRLVEEHKICFDDWIEGDSSAMAQYGFESQAVHRALGGTGLLRVWYRPELLDGDKVGSQSLDHYATVLQIAGYMQKLGIKATVNHYEDVDIVAELGDIKVAFEYERPGSHSKDELIEKKMRGETKYSRVVFIGTVENIKYLAEAVGIANVVRRGSMLGETIHEIFKL